MYNLKIIIYVGMYATCFQILNLMQPPGTGNANDPNSPFDKTLMLDGTECLLMLEFCRKFNCTLHSLGGKILNLFFQDGSKILIIFYLKLLMMNGVISTTTILDLVYLVLLSNERLMQGYLHSIHGNYKLSIKKINRNFYLYTTDN